jgi:hypothetical protein
MVMQTFGGSSLLVTLAAAIAMPAPACPTALGPAPLVPTVLGLCP